MTRYCLSLIWTLSLSSCLLTNWEAVYAQGLVGAKGGMRGLAQPPAAMVGKSDEERWQLFLRTQRRLLGMSRAEVVKLYGPGSAYLKRAELCFKLTEEARTSKKGDVAYLELTLKFRDNKVCSYCVEAVYWG